ncbi:hypothetical protein N7490_000750, partial [Penicillium lividum]
PSESSQSGHEQVAYDGTPPPIAVVGMAMRLPGGVDTAEKFWEMLINKQDGHCEVPESRYNAEAFYSATRPGTVKTRHGYFLKDSIGHIDRSFFSMSRIEAEKIDPQQRLLLEVVWEAMVSGGQTDWRGQNIGCFVGVFGEDWLEMSSKDPQFMDRSHVLSTGDFALSNRVSYEYDLQGPSVTYRTACSSSMVALHEACQAIYSGECASAVVAGSNIILTPTMTMSISDNMILSPDGLCKTFDATADGYGRGEAVNAIFIKPLAEAMRQGDPIRSVIRSTTVNCDGRTLSITNPSSQAQERLIRRAYKKAGIDDLSQTAFFECHGTGTIAGDTAETSVVAKVFPNGIYIGGVKPNVGHSEGASGLTSIIKATLALEKRVIPPNAHFNNPNPDIPFQAGLKVPLESTPWPAGRCERVSVNSFGIGGTNAHVIMDSLSSVTHVQSDIPPSRTTPRVLVLSAKNSKSLQKGVEKIKQYATGSPNDLNDLAYTLGTRRDHLAHRAFAIMDQDGGELEFERSQAISSTTAFIFTGQGAQWAGMGRELTLQSDCFLRTIRGLDQALAKLADAPTWTLEGELLKDDQSSRLDEAEFSQPLCTAVQIALVNILQEWGVCPDAVIGHSSGEIAAAYAAGAIGAEVAISVSYLRGKALKDLTEEHGGMAAVGISAEEAKKYLVNGVTVACDNSPQSITLSGNQDTLAVVLKGIQANCPDTFCRQLNVSVAYHSEHMKSPGRVYESLMTPVMNHRDAMKPLYSTVTGDVISDPSFLNAAYWRDNLQSPVLFNSAVQKFLRHSRQPAVFVEIGPHSTLSSPLSQIFRSQDVGQGPKYIPTLIRSKPTWKALLITAGRLHISGLSIKLSQVNGPGKVLTDLPAYPWQHEEVFLNQTRLVKKWMYPKEPHHELLGPRSLESTDFEPSWRRILFVSHVPWLWDHVLGKDLVFPCAGYIAMLGEAIRQTTGSEDYTIRNLLMKNPLTLNDSEPTELLTSLRPVKMTDTVDSSWYEFTVSAYQGGSWKKHCVGDIRAGSQKQQAPRSINPYARFVPSKTWYDVMKKRGLNFGPRFKLLENISASPSTSQAAASVQYDDTDDAAQGSRYSLHPTIIDQSLQMLGVAMTRGIPRHLTKLCMPVAIQEIYIGPSRGAMFIDASCDQTGSSIVGNAVMTADNKTVLSMEKGMLFAIDDIDGFGKDSPMVAQVDWKPHIDLIPLEDQVTPCLLNEGCTTLLRQIACSIVRDAADKARELVPSDPHLKSYQVWLCSRADKDLQSKNAAIVNSLCQSDHLGEALQQLEKRIPQMIPLLNLVRRASSLSCDLIEGRIGCQDVGSRDESLRTMCQSLSTSLGCWNFFSWLGHSNPTIRVLIIGLGNGFSIMQSLCGLTSKHGTPMYAKCTIADRSPDRVSQAKERFAWAQDTDFIHLDISKNPMEQGFEAESYDLIVASDAFDAEMSLSSLKNIYTLLVPGGRLFHQPSSPSLYLLDFVMGLYPEWRVQDDYDVDKFFMTTAQWKFSLEQAGFIDGDTLTTTTAHKSLYDNGITISLRPQTPVAHGVEIALLYLSKITDWARSVESIFAKEGYSVSWFILGQQPPPGDVISLIDLEGPFFDDISADRFVKFQLLITQIMSSCMLWVTEGSQMTCKDPRFGLVQGVARTLRHEAMPDFATLEVDEFNDRAAGSVVQVLKHLHTQKYRNLIDPDNEFAEHKGKIHVSRAHWILARECVSPSSLADQGNKILDIGSYGLLNSLSWINIPQSSLEDDEVEVEMKYVGLNFRDIMVALGVVGNKSEFGVEGSGIVRRVGNSVEHVVVGESVIVVGNGLLCTHKVVAADHCLPLSHNLSLEDAATVACVYGTVFYSLVSIGRLQRGQSVLIHCGCGGVGIAAIQICQMLGAEIFTTVGNQDKVQYLMDTFGIPRENIFDSRSSSFYEGVMKQTGHLGVNIVLNSLSGELLHLSWRCVAKFGRMIELGKRDILGHGQLEMEFFGGNRSFTGVDMMQIINEDIGIARPMIQQCMEYIGLCKIKPIRPITIFDARVIEQAFWHMQTGRHMGKIVVKMPDDSSVLRVCDRSTFFSLPSDGSIIIIGGLGGLGRTVATWLVEKGARDLVFLGRSAGRSPESILFLKELESQGCSVTAISGSVAMMEDVNRAVLACKMRISGVVQMSMVLRDQLFSNMSHNEWLSALDPKYHGTWNLHHALANHKLDFFVCFGSLAGLCGNAGQANYAAANSFLDAFAKYRRANGLAASVIDLGLMNDAGFAYEHAPKLIQRAHSASMQTVEEYELVQALELAISQPVQIALGLGTTKPLSISGVVPPWTRDARYNLWNRIILESETDTLGLNTDVRDLMELIKNTPEILDDPATEQQVIKVLGREIGSHLANTDDMEETEICNMVIDSLAIIEIRSWYRRHLSLELPLMEISNAKTIGGLGKATVHALRAKYQGNDSGIASSSRSSAESSTQYQQDAVLGRTIRPRQEPVPEWYAESEGHVILTGATGFLGTFFLSGLARLPQVKIVTCLIRAPDGTAAMNRLEASFAKFGLSVCRDKIRAVPGDLTQKDLGLESAEFARLSKECSAIFHLGAVINYTTAYSAHREVNVLGLIQVLRLANTHRLKSVHYFSGMAAYGPSGFLGGQTHIPENERPVAGSGALQHHMGYPISKFVAENICWDAISNGFPLAIYRPGFVLGHSTTGVGNPSDVINRLMSTCINVGAYPIPPNQPNCFVPVDFVCAAALEISMSNENIGQAYNLIHPNSEENIDLLTTFDIVGQLTSPPLRRLEFAAWVELMAQTKGHRLSGIAPIVADKVAESAIWWNGTEDAVVVNGTENVRRALAHRPDILKCKTMFKLLGTYFKTWSQLAEIEI